MLDKKINKKAQISESDKLRFIFSPICKKGQISETMTWVVATLIIVFVLSVFIYSSNIFGKAKQITFDTISSIDKKNPVLSISKIKVSEKTSGYEKEIAKWDSSDDRSVFAYILSSDEVAKKTIFDGLNVDVNLFNYKIQEFGK
jgi:hypothetical protein